MATEEQLIEALARADAAGETADAQAIAVALKQIRAANTAPQAAPPPARSARLNSIIAHGATAGFSDEATSALFAGTVGTGKGVVNAIRQRDLGEIPKAIGREFNNLQTFQREEREAFRSERPVTSTVAEVGGALATSGIGALKSGTLKAAAATGAIQGGLYGAGATTGGLKERAKGAAVGAGIGAVAAPALQAVANKAGQFFTARRTGQTAPDETKRAFNAVRDLLEYDLGSRSKAEAALRVWMKNGGNPDEIFDLAGPSLQNLQREIASQRPSSAVEFVNRIRAEASDDVRGVVAGSISKTDQSVRASRAALKIAREAQAGPLYEKAYATRIDTRDIERLIADRPELRRAIAIAERKVLNRGNPVTLKETGRPTDAAMFQVEKLVTRLGGKLSRQQGSGLSASQYLEFDGIPTTLPKSARREFFQKFPRANGAEIDGKFTVRIADHNAVSGRGSNMAAIDLRKPIDGQLSEIEEMIRFLQARGHARTVEVASERPMLTVEVLDRAKGVLDDRINILMRKGANRDAGDIIAAKNALVSKIDELVPSYAEARNIWAGSMASENALDLGKKFLAPSYAADDLAADIGSMTQSEKEFLRVGVAEQLENALDNLKDGATAGRRFANEAFRRKVRILFDDPTDAQAFIDVVKKAEERALKAQRIDPFSGSQTEPRLRAREAFDRASQGRVEQAADVLADGVQALPRKAVKAATKATRGARGEKVSDILEEVFFGQGGSRLQPATQPQVQIPYRAGPQANVLLQSNSERNQ